MQIILFVMMKIAASLVFLLLQGLDVLEIMRNIHVFVSKYLYNLNNQVTTLIRQMQPDREADIVLSLFFNYNIT